MGAWKENRDVRWQPASQRRPSHCSQPRGQVHRAAAQSTSAQPQTFSDFLSPVPDPHPEALPGLHVPSHLNGSVCPCPSHLPSCPRFESFSKPHPVQEPLDSVAWC